MNFGQNFVKWHTSQQKAWWGDAATKENDFAYDYLPKRDGAYDVLAIFERMYQGKVNGFISQGFNPLAALPNKKKVSAAMAKLKYLVVIEPLRTETSEFWKNFGEENNVKPEDIKTEVIRLPAGCFAEDAGSFTSSGRVIQWHWAGAEPPGEGKVDREIIGTLMRQPQADLAVICDNYAASVKRAANAGSVFCNFICSVRFQLSLRKGFFTDRTEPAAPPAPEHAELGEVGAVQDANHLVAAVAHVDVVIVAARRDHVGAESPMAGVARPSRAALPHHRRRTSGLRPSVGGSDRARRRSGAR